MILLVTVSGLLGAVFSALKISEANEETSAAHQAVRDLAEGMNAVAFNELFFAYNTDPTDDVDGIDHLQEFVLDGFRNAPDDNDGLVAEVIFPTVQRGGRLELREDVQDDQLGMPRDLNGDGSIDSDDHSGDYVVLPMIVRARWMSSSGTRQVQIARLLRSE